MYRLWHAFVGWYGVRLEGEDVLAFVHALASEQILFWNFRKNQDGYTLRTGLQYAELIRNRAGQTGITVSLTEAHGLPFILAKYKYRFGLLLGMLIGLFLLFYAELFVWKISVHGNTVLSEAEVIKALDSYGIRVGSYIPSLSIRKAQNEFLLHYKEVSSFAINVKGTHLEIEILERTHAPEIEDHTGFCNMVAARDGIVCAVEATAGSAMVKPGDVVTEGQILISSFTVGSRSLYYPHHARGTVIAQVYEHYSVVIPLSYAVKSYTGKTQSKTVYTLLGKDFPLFFTEESRFARFDSTVTTTPIFLFGFIETPFVRTRAEYREYQAETVTLTVEQATKEAEKALSDWLARQTDPVCSCEHTVTYDAIQNACVLNASVILESNIAIDRALAPGELPPEDLKGREIYDVH